MERKCDLCGSYFKVEEDLINCMSIFHKNYMNNYRQFNIFNICPGCAEEILETVERRKK